VQIGCVTTRPAATNVVVENEQTLAEKEAGTIGSKSQEVRVLVKQLRCVHIYPHVPELENTSR